MKELKRMARRVLSLLLAAVFCAALLPWAAMPAEAANAVDTAALLGSIPYCGDRSKCQMTAAQAEAFADVIKQKRQIAASQTPGDAFVSYFNAALFDAGDGIPALWLCGGYADEYSAFYEDVVNEIWAWDGSQAVLDYQNDSYARLTDRGIVHDGFRLDEMFTYYSGTGFTEYISYNKALFPLAHGRVSKTPSQVYADIAFYNEPASIEQLRSTVQERDRRSDMMGDFTWIPGLTYDYTTVKEEQYQHLVPEVEWCYVYRFDGGTGTDGLNWDNTLLKCERETLSQWVTGSDMASALRAYAQTLRLQGATTEEVLAAIPYYGDISKCRMTSAQAEAFAEVLANMNIEGPAFGDSIYMGHSAHAALCDVENNGNPILVSHYNISSTMDNWSGEHIESLYVWNDGQVKEIGSFRSATYGTAASENYVTFGKNASGGYSWSEWRREMAGLWQYDTISVVKDGVLQSTVYETDYDWENDTTTLYINGVLQSTVKGEPNISELLKQNGAPQFEVEEHWIDCGIGLSRAAMIAALRAYAEAATFPVYAFPQADETDGYYQDVARAVSGRGTLQAVYRLLEDLYYVLLENQGAYTGAVVRGVTRNGKPVWEISREDGEPAEESALEALLNRLLSSSNLTLDFGKLRGSPAAAELTAYLRELLENYDGLSPNDAAKTGLAAFLDNAVPAVASGSVSGPYNRLTLDRTLVSQLADTAKNVWNDLSSVLNSSGVALNKTVTPRARLLWQDVDPDQACQLTVDNSLVSGLNGADLQVLLGSANRYIQLSSDSLRRLTDDLETFSIQFSQMAGNTYSISFLDRDGQVLDSLPSPVTLGLPAPSMTSTIMASYAGGSDNWGGQYDEASGVLAFETRYSGQYEVLENNIRIDDITDLSEESQAAIRFLVSKGYLTLDGDGQFNPQLPVTRYDFTRTLVSMFFALDRSLTVSFTDVPEDSGYYDYVASAEANQLVQGVTDTTFAGEMDLSVEQMLTLTGRTLAEQKGYTVPADAGQYLSAFEDGAAVSDWARLHSALSVREGLWERGGTLEPQRDITREQAALVLYRLFLRLYEVPPVALDLPPKSEAAEPDNNGAAIIAAGAAGIAVGAGVAVMISKKRKSVASK